ncbi:hypothetical protein ACFRMQ_19700 [Kitasatospora sp. NPDC056783]|uniref:hypothetical protein n=1 Tax=Kitasatospora sp. NPDC056783 TaxID=3345943 RepID=UPI0036AAFBF5
MRVDVPVGSPDRAVIRAAVRTAVRTAVALPAVVDIADDGAVASASAVASAVRTNVGPAVRAIGGRPTGRTHTAGCVRINRSGRLKTSHGSRLFDGEGPTGEENNAARAAGPPTG